MISTIKELLKAQKDFQLRIGNDVPNPEVSFENVRESLSQNIYQQIEFQEFMEASEDDRKEELVDFLLFMLNKYIYLGIVEDDFEDLPLNYLWSEKSNSSFCQCTNLFSQEQNDFTTFIRKHCVFKPWKSKTTTNFVDTNAVIVAFLNSIELFKQMSHIIYVDYSEFKSILMSKLQLNIDRQNSGY